jgi:hypothetical protein
MRGKIALCRPVTCTTVHRFCLMCGTNVGHDCPWTVTRDGRACYFCLECWDVSGSAKVFETVEARGGWLH